ncbi:hypothetical protein [Thermomonas sp.]
MSAIDRNWLSGLDDAMKLFFAIDHDDAGMSEDVLLRYADLPPREAALQFGEDYDLPRIHIGWG